MIPSDSPKEVIFMGGSITISPAGTFEANGQPVKYNAKVKLGSILDKSGSVKPNVFLNMVKAVNSDPEIIKLLEKL